MHRRSPIPLEPAAHEVPPRGGRRHRFPSAALLTILALAAPGAEAQEPPDEPDAPAYTYRDGDRTLKVVLQEDLVLTRAQVAAGDDSEVLASVGDAVILRLQPAEDDPTAVSSASGALAARPPDAQPVFRSEGGMLMALPGGVIVLFDEEWDAARAMGFFAAEGISRDRVSELPLHNGYLVATAPGFPSLELANRLADSPGVEVSSPNWWRDVVPF